MWNYAREPRLIDIAIRVISLFAEETHRRVLIPESMADADISTRGFDNATPYNGYYARRRNQLLSLMN